MAEPHSASRPLPQLGPSLCIAKQVREDICYTLRVLDTKIQVATTRETRSLPATGEWLTPTFIYVGYKGVLYTLRSRSLDIRITRNYVVSADTCVTAVMAVDMVVWSAEGEDRFFSAFVEYSPAFSSLSGRC